MRGYRISPSWPGIGLFVLVMAPNALWAVFLSGDILHQPSATPGLNAAMTVCQWLFVAALCLLESDKALPFTLRDRWTAAAGVLLGLYWGCWLAYFCGWEHIPLLLGLTVLPCAAFLLFAAGRRNWWAVFTGIWFSLLHLCHFWGNYMLHVSC